MGQWDLAQNPQEVNHHPDLRPLLWVVVIRVSVVVVGSVVSRPRAAAERKTNTVFLLNFTLLGVFMKGN